METVWDRIRQLDEPDPGGRYVTLALDHWQQKRRQGSLLHTILPIAISIAASLLILIQRFDWPSKDQNNPIVTETLKIASPQEESRPHSVTAVSATNKNMNNEHDAANTSKVSAICQARSRLKLLQSSFVLEQST